jgi:16S rRNA (adenine1518-N6/adenine1519-N6)-dimethyltransferase
VLPEAVDRPLKEREWLTAYGIRPRKRWGQNFLLDPNVPAEIVRRAGWPSGCHVLEIGAGGGALTRALLEAEHTVVAVELDPFLVPLLQKRFEKPIEEGRLQVVNADFLLLDLPSIRPPGPSFRLAGNLPYGITTPMILKALAWRELLDGAVFMIQREYGERLVARAGDDAYSSLSVWTAAHACTRTLLRVGRSSFWPRPGVESVVVEMTFPTPPPYRGSYPRLERVLRAAFGQRRKTLENALSHGLDLPKEKVRRALLEAGIDPVARAETIALDGFATLVERIPEVA